MIAPDTLDALEAVANELGFTLYRHAYFRDIGIDAEYADLATASGRCRLGSDPKRHAEPVEFEGTPRECAAFLIGWRDAAGRHHHYVWRHGVTASGKLYKQCGCGRVAATTASQDELELAKREHREVAEIGIVAKNGEQIEVK